MEKSTDTNYPMTGDYLVIDGNVIIVSMIDLDNDVWVEVGNPDLIYEMIPSTGKDIIEHSDNFSFLDDKTLDDIDISKYYTYLPKYFYKFERMKLTKLAKISYNIPHTFTGELWLLIRRRK